MHYTTLTLDDIPKVLSGYQNGTHGYIRWLNIELGKKVLKSHFSPHFRIAHAAATSGSEDVSECLGSHNYHIF